MTIMKDEIPVTNDGIKEFIILSQKEMARIEPQYKLYLALKKRIKVAEEKLRIHQTGRMGNEAK